METPVLPTTPSTEPVRNMRTRLNANIALLRDGLAQRVAGRQVETEAEMLALDDAQPGLDIVFRKDTETFWFCVGSDTTVLSSWLEIGGAADANALLQAIATAKSEAITTSLTAVGTAKSEVLQETEAKYGKLPKAALSVQNLVANPNLETDASGWTISGYGTGGAGTAGRTAGAGENGSAGYVIDFTTASSQSGSNTGPDAGPTAAPNRVAVSPGDVLSASIFAKSTTDVNIYGTINFYNGGTFVSRVLGNFHLLRGGAPGQRIHTLRAVVPAGVTHASTGIRFNSVAEIGTGDLTLSRAQIVRNSNQLPYVDGSQAGAAWASTPGNSISSRVFCNGTSLVSVWGDSHVQLAHGGGYTLTQWLNNLSGSEFFNGGRGGETSTGIAIRQGGIVPVVTVAGGQIPASGSVNVTLTPLTTYRDDTLWNFYGTLAGVSGTLARAAGGQWTFTRDAAGSATTVAAGSPFVVHTFTQYAALAVLGGGNNLPNKADILRDIAAMAAKAQSRGAEYLVMSLYNNAGEPSGSAGYNTIVDINNTLAGIYGQRFVDLRSWLIANGLSVSGITPSGSDVTAIAEDRIPPSLMADTIHLNDAGRKAVSVRLLGAINATGVLAAAR